MRLWVLLLPLLAAGCVTSERVPDAITRGYDAEGNVEYRQTRRLRVAGQLETHSESDLTKAVQRQPNDPAGWFRLGEHYDRVGRYPEALRAYLRLQRLLREQGRGSGRDYIEGDYLVGRTYTLLGDWDQARRWLREVLKREPGSRYRAARSPFFRETHFLLGTIHFAHEEWQAAERHFDRYEHLTGDTLRGLDMRTRIERELHPERSNYAKIR